MVKSVFLKQKPNKETGMKILFGTAASVAILATVTICIFLFIKGIPAASAIGLGEFLFGDSWMPNVNDTIGGEINGKYGIFPMIVGTIYATVGAVIIGGTLGYFTAIFLSKFCPKKLKAVLTQLVNLLAGIPSVVYGFFGMRLLLPLLGEASPNGSGSGVLAVSIILGIMIMPTIVALSKTAIDAVPHAYYEGARALGDSHAQSVFGTVVPAAKSGITASFILGIGRAVGETMAVIMVAGNNPVIPDSIFGSFRTMTANVVLEMGYAGELQLGALIATGCVLFFFVLVINTLFGLIRGGNKPARKSKKHGKQERKDGNFAMLLANIKAVLHRRSKVAVKGKQILCYLCMAVSVTALIAIVVFVFAKGIPHISLDLLTKNFDYGEAPTIMPSIVVTVMLVVLSMVVAIPLGLCTAVFLSEYTKSGNKFVRIIRGAIELLAGIPSIVYGLFGMVFFCTMLKLGTSVLAGSLTVAIMIIPIICRSTEESLKAVPDSYREGSFALGAGKARTIFKVVLPSAMPGILAAIILAIGRVISESAPLMFTMGASLKGLPQKGFFSSGTSLAVALYVLAGEGLYLNEAYATACVLILIVLTLNILSTLLVTKLQKRFVGLSK